jgi:hypothetical protein
MNGIPSNGTYVILGNGQVGTQSTSVASTLPDSVRLASATGGVQASTTSSATNSTGNGTKSHSSTPSVSTIVGGVVGGIALVGILGAIVAVILLPRQPTPTWR